MNSIEPFNTIPLTFFYFQGILGIPPPPPPQGLYKDSDPPAFIGLKLVLTVKMKFKQGNIFIFNSNIFKKNFLQAKFKEFAPCLKFDM